MEGVKEQARIGPSSKGSRGVPGEPTASSCQQPEEGTSTSHHSFASLAPALHSLTCSTASLLNRLPSSSATQGGCSGMPVSWHVVHRASRSSSGFTCSHCRQQYSATVRYMAPPY